MIINIGRHYPFVRRTLLSLSVNDVQSSKESTNQHHDSSFQEFQHLLAYNSVRLVGDELLVLSNGNGMTAAGDFSHLEVQVNAICV